MLDKKRHEIIMRNILKDIYADRFLSTVLGFKGGTACYFFYNLPRFSTDLDFSFLKDADIQKVFQKLITICGKYGNLLKKDLKRNIIFLLLSYEKSLHKIKIEVSTRNFDDNYEIRNLLGISILTMKKEDMFAHKLVSISNRTAIANRDLFDSYFFFKSMWDINENIIKLRTNKSLSDYFKFLINFIEKNVSEKKIMDGLGQLLNKDMQIWAKKNLKKELLFAIKNYLT